MASTLKYIFILLMLLTYQTTWGQSLSEIRQDINRFKVFTSLEEASKHAEQVYRLTLSDQKIDEKILARQLPKFEHLRELVLNNTFMSKLPSSIGKLKELQFLEIGHLEQQNPNLQNLPGSISQLKELVYINLIGNPNLHWEKTFQSLSELPKLINIALMHNSFMELPKGVTKLSQLKMIWLGKNPQLELKDALIKLSELDHLEQMGVGGSQYTHLPKEIALLKNIQNLWLSGNKWKSLEGIQNLPHLSQLSIHKCGLKVLPKAILECEKLKYLSLVENPELDFDQVFTQLPASVKVLNISRNGIKKLSIVAIKTAELVQIIIKDNKLSPTNIKEIQEALPGLKIQH